MMAKHRHVGALCKIADCETCVQRMIDALESLGYRVVENIEFKCDACGEELKAVDGVLWHAGENGDYMPVSHAAAPVPNEAVRA